ncbi:hypothetical protein FEAC_17250 [Ferrimicrobium acidiphilum DSM 19497]|uniref:Uncharacterized protein n=1 Tax=Ferrimicrobium acidiphilum DSM 19497 TaxID=1121877 RepID=A0A0D8FT93_9ACTN|nr:hypothetical protein FEAC_17250 [Ferrimicrobium acidiphilum DSM 19497]
MLTFGIGVYVLFTSVRFTLVDPLAVAKFANGSAVRYS